jgi:hypothetical protein
MQFSITALWRLLESENSVRFSTISIVMGKPHSRENLYYEIIFRNKGKPSLIDVLEYIYWTISKLLTHL